MFRRIARLRQQLADAALVDTPDGWLFMRFDEQASCQMVWRTRADAVRYAHAVGCDVDCCGDVFYIGQAKKWWQIWR